MVIGVGMGNQKYEIKSEEEWRVIREEYELGGISMAKLAKKHDVGVDAVKDRNRKDGWVSMRKVKRLAGNPEALERCPDGPLKEMAEKWKARDDEHRERLWKEASAALDRFWAGNPVPADFSEAERCAKLIDRALGEEREGGDPNLAILVNGPVSVSQS